jgi:hypothetical protein
MSVRCARSGPKERAWASNFHPQSALLDGMDGKSKFSPSQKWLQLYDKLLVAPYGRVAQLGEHLLCKQAPASFLLLAPGI